MRLTGSEVIRRADGDELWVEAGELEAHPVLVFVVGADVDAACCRDIDAAAGDQHVVGESCFILEEVEDAAAIETLCVGGNATVVADVAATEFVSALIDVA